MARAIKNRDGSYSVEGSDGGVAEAIAAICRLNLDEAQQEIDAANVHRRLAQVERETRGSAMSQARAEIAAERKLAEAKRLMAECDDWSRHFKRRLRGGSGRETRSPLDDLAVLASKLRCEIESGATR